MNQIFKYNVIGKYSSKGWKGGYTGKDIWY